MIFLLGLHVMIFNEGFVMLRHVSPIAAQLRQELIKDWVNSGNKYIQHLIGCG